MKKICILLLVYCLASSCFGPPEPQSNYTAVYMSRSTFESSIRIEPVKSSLKTGKIYSKDQLMLINDINKGFQVYNYSNPLNPVAIGYINVPGATDVAIRNSTLYINQATDLVSVNYNSLANSLTVTGRIKKAFPPKVSPDGFTAKAKKNQIVIDWTN